MNDARRYLELRKQIPGELCGPLARLSTGDYDPTELNQATARAISAVVQIDARTYRAPSPWHAEAWLLVMANLAAQVAHRSTIPGVSLPFDPNLGAPLFRGQRNPDWTLSATALRYGHAHAEQAGTILRVFMLAMCELFKSDDNRMNSPYAHMAAGQHYGLDTSLLDFTPDPHIGVFFACKDADPGSDVAVYAMPLASAVERSSVLVLPPPWLHRVYRQRGMFLDCSKLPDGDFIRPRCAFRILFPADPGYIDEVVRQEQDVLLPDDPWYACATAWAKERGAKPDAATATPVALARELTAACGPSPHILFFNTFDDLNWLNRVVESIEWLVLKLIGGRIVYDIGTFEALLHFNEALFRSLRVMYQYLLNSGLNQQALRYNRAVAACETIAGLMFPGDKV